MHRMMTILVTGLFLFGSHNLSGQVTGLQGWTIYLDSGHSQKENLGLFNYSEAEKVLRVALALREMLQSQTDIDTVYMSRTNDQQSISLTQRTTDANNVAAHFYYSIHSDAPSASANSTLLLYGGWREGGQTVEKTPHGGKKMGDIIVVELTAAMRISTRGNYADRTFYQGLVYEHENKWPYLHVNRVTIMASVLSEAGFHTNPTQQQRNLNAQWKRLEAQAAFWSILKYHNISRPPVGIATGYITDLENGLAINGATITINGWSYTTDTYGSLFQKYSTDPDELRNGFYYIENLPVGETFEVMVTAEGYYSDTTSATIKSDNFTFLDIQLISRVPPYIVSSTPANEATGVLPNATIQITFSRALLRSSAEGNIYLLDPLDERVAGTFTWSNGDRTISLKPTEYLLTDTTYRLVIGADVHDLYAHRFDGNGDGVSGDSLVITFKTGSPDTVPPFLLSAFPDDNAVLATPNHVITLLFNELLDEVSVNTSWFQLEEIGGSVLFRQVQHWKSGDKSGVNVIPTSGFQPGKSYLLTIYPDVKDQAGNKLGSYIEKRFTILHSNFQYTLIDDFNAGVSNWYQPLTSGSTTGVDSGSFSSDGSVLVTNIPSNTGSARLNFHWRTSASDWLLREYLNTGSPRSVLWTKQGTRLQVYLHGDGSGTLFRFAIDDSVGIFSPDRAENHEVSEWVPITWVGWRLVEWDLENDPVGDWIGNKKLEGTLRFDSFQLKYVPETSTSSGQIYFDQLQLAKGTVTSVERVAETIPESFELFQNYPNPFNPETRIEYSTSRSGSVQLTIIDVLGRTVRTLVSDVQAPGRYVASWDGRDDNGRQVASGIYLYRLQATGYVLTRKMTLLK